MSDEGGASVRDRHVVFFSWRDTTNPEGGGAELYMERIARGLVDRGARVTVFCAEHEMAPRDEIRDGIRFIRRGSRLGIYARGISMLAAGRFGAVDAVVDVQNGLPFFTRLGTRVPVIVLVHHVHREQWPVIFPGALGRIGWWIEHRVAPRLYRSCQYIAVSTATRTELIAQGIDGQRIAVVHNGTDQAPDLDVPKSPHPSICVVGRLVPHKQVEHAIDAWAALLPDLPGLTLTIAGAGWWEPELRDHAAAAMAMHGVAHGISFEGQVTEGRKHELYAESWLMLLPSLKEGWGLVVGEAGMHGTPTIAYRSAGGTQESIEDGASGLLVDSPTELIAAARQVLLDPARRADLSAGARAMSHRFTWGRAQRSFAAVVGDVIEHQGPTPDHLRG